MKETLAQQITRLRVNMQLTIRELAKRADVTHSLIASLQSGKRVIGEYQARKIGAALGLRDSELEQFVLLAIDACSEKVLNESKSYPAQLLNLLASQLREAGIIGESIYRCVADGDGDHQNVTLWLTGDRKAQLKTELVLT